MILKCVKKLIVFNGDKTEPMATTVNKTYQCLPLQYGYIEVLVFNDNHEWRRYPINAFAPIEPDPIISWEE